MLQELQIQSREGAHQRRHVVFENPVGLGDSSAGKVLACKCKRRDLSPLNPCEKPGAEVCKRQLSGSGDWWGPGLTGRQSYLAMGSRLVRERNKVDPVS